jgi:uncharacterized surface protein with fasciclin (FAS1) repeats
MPDSTITPALQNLVDTVAANGSFKTFSQAVESAGLADALRATGPFTVFAPTDAAFDQLPPGQLEALFKPENKAELAALVNHHVITGRKYVGDMKSWVKTRTAHGQTTPMMPKNGTICFGGATVTAADIGSSNGVIHGIDKVNIPTPAVEPSTVR